MSVRSPPSSPGCGTYPFVRLDRGQRAAARRRGVESSTSAWASRARRRRRSSARRWPPRSTPLVDLPAGRRACPSCARRSPAGSRRRFGARARPGHRGHPHARLQGGDLPPRAGRRRRPRRRARRPPTRSTSAARRSPASAVLELPLTRPRRLPARPRRRRPHWDARRRCCGSTTRTTRRAPRAPLAFYERAAALAREHGFVLASDEAYSELYFGGEPPASALQVADRSNVVGVQHALQALLDARLPLRLRRRRPGADRGAQALPPERRRRAAGVRPARGGRGLGRRGARRGGARALPRQARRRCCPRSRRVGLRHAGGDATFFLWLDAGAGRRRARRALARARASSSRPARSSAPAGAGYLRVALVPTLEECERAAELTSVGVQRGVEAAPAAGARQRLDRAGLRVAAEQQAARAATARAP